MTMYMTRHIPNIITFARLALTPLLVYFILQSEYMGAVVVFTVICLTGYFRRSRCEGAWSMYSTRRMYGCIY